MWVGAPGGGARSAGRLDDVPSVKLGARTIEASFESLGSLVDVFERGTDD